MEKIIEFVKVPPLYSGSGSGSGSGNGSGYGSGSGSGYGNGDGNGDGNGSGNGNGSGYGSGNGSGYGDGSGDGNGDGDGSGDGKNLQSLNNLPIYIIDSIQTIVLSVKNGIAQGYVVADDLSLAPCYIVKNENLFSHGSSIKEALSSLQKKVLLKLPISQRIIKFKEKFTDLSFKYVAKDFYDWHYFLTGSCDLGRKSFILDKNIDLNTDLFTVLEFINLVKDSYGQDIIQNLKDSYK